jgi:flagellar protein FlaG
MPGGNTVAVSALAGDGGATNSVATNSAQSAAKYKAASAAPPDGGAVQKALDEVNHAVQKVAPGLEFSVDQQSGSTIVKVVDSQTKEILRQIPGEEVLRIARALDKMRGHLVQTKA